MIRNRCPHYFTFAKKHFAVWVTLGLCLLIGEGILDGPCRLAAATDEPEEFHGPPPHPGYPDPFEIGYILFDTFSPNKQFGIIYPNRLLEESPDFIVDLKHSRILALLETGEPYFEGKNHGDLAAHWAPNSSAAVIENSGKWEPIGLLLVELKDGKVILQTDLLDSLNKIFSPAIAKAQHSRVEDSAVGELDITGVKWKTGKSLQVEIKCEGSTNPKGFEEESSWYGELTAVWDVAQRKLVRHQLARVSFHAAGRKEQ